MYRPSFAFWYCVFLLLITSLGKNDESQEQFTNGDEWSDNSTMPYELNANSMRNQGNQTTLMRYNSRENSVKNESETNSMHELDGNSKKDDDHNIVLYEMCNDTCVQHCCSLVLNNCKEAKMKNFMNNNNNLTLNDLLGQYSYLFIDYSCAEEKIPFDIMNNENTMFFDNSSLNLSRHDRFISLISKCLNISRRYIDVCDGIVNQIKESRKIYIDVVAAVFIASLLCLLMTFIVYSICSELQNMHGYALRSHVVSLFVAHTIFLIVEKDYFEESYPACVAESLLYYFCYLASLLWQNVICFDILRTFGAFRILRKSIKQSKKKMFLMSSFYVWGIASIYIIICTIMDFVPRFVPDDIRPNICKESNFGFAHYALVAYFDILDTDRFLKDAESKRHTHDKQRFMMYLKLFLLMDINMTLKWTLSMILQSIGKEMPFYVLIIMDTMEGLQGLIIFIVFVCKRRIIRLLLKQFGCENSYLYGRTSTSNNCRTTTSHTSSTVIEQELSSSEQANSRVRSSSEVVENTTI
nr:PREDICTED: G-protein coupled receptor Mth2-like isoform X2 [Linepithema humile]